eukprot:1368069-Pleurochrysis_carterae.AAC.3
MHPTVSPVSSLCVPPFYPSRHNASRRVTRMFRVPRGCAYAGARGDAAAHLGHSQGGKRRRRHLHGDARSQAARAARLAAHHRIPAARARAEGAAQEAPLNQHARKGLKRAQKIL